MRKDDPIPAHLPTRINKILTALVEVLRWARKVQAPMPLIDGLNLQENHIIETYKKRGCAVSTQRIAARRANGRIDYFTHLSAPWIDSRPHPQIANQLAWGTHFNVKMPNRSPPTTRRQGRRGAFLRIFQDECLRPAAHWTNIVLPWI
jgi:hypothetical protein